ncbi:flagellar hook-associated 2-like protein [Shewanella denitrificans OS217]|uniref:Flagellar hook-associated protein 2 n=1 Tax=Shewanella denitrificans (strain OS217 / ATCC BAA-1090 / DSM 15013) TaxID=318161 RepID=Q12I13_SHEDO|nr:flagellar filament capping protein FliD [Shewanella denitrificans]ABE56913.1 flagellar hook-associated 2-like protein [Shewanella denitrificans OS217]
MIGNMSAAQFSQQLISADRAGKDNLYKGKLSTQKTQLDAYKLLETSMKLLSTKLKSIDTEAFSNKKADINNDFAKVTVKAGAPKGNYDLNVTQLAQSHQLTKTYASEDTLLPASGLFTVQLGSDPTKKLSIDLATVNGGAGITVTQLRDLINKDAANPGMQASLVRTGGQVELMLSANNGGASNNLTVNLDGADWGMTQRRAAQDAQLTLNGISITSSNNYLENVIDGVNLDLIKVHGVGESSQIKVEDDSEATTQAVKDFVSNFNTLLSQINQLSRSMGSTVTDAAKSDDKDVVKVSSGQIGVLKGDSSVRLVQSRLRDAVFNDAPNGMRLSDIGIEIGRDGLLKMDDKKFEAALKADGSKVQAMFSDNGSYIDKIEAVLKPYTEFDGLLSMKKKTIDSQIDRIEDSVERHNYQMTQKYNIYLAQFTAMEATINQLSAASSLFSPRG